jgi:three-Cys-motif partner protein
MPTGTEGGLLDSPKPQSVYKHGLLDQYVIQYATMTASKLTPKRCVLFDGFAGRGRFDTGEPGSAEHMMLAAQKRKGATQIDLLLVEKSSGDFATLDEVADEYRARGIRVVSHNDDCGNRLGDMLKLASGASLFVFLDPCGAVLPMDSIKDVLRRRRTWPRTEVLLNFSADLVRRAGGQVKKGQRDAHGVAKADAVCGGEWWLRGQEDQVVDGLVMHLPPHGHDNGSVLSPGGQPPGLLDGACFSGRIPVRPTTSGECSPPPRPTPRTPPTR